MVIAVVLDTREAGREALMVTAAVLNTGEAGREALMVAVVVLNTAVRSSSCAFRPRVLASTAPLLDLPEHSVCWAQGYEVLIQFPLSPRSVTAQSPLSDRYSPR